MTEAWVQLDTGKSSCLPGKECNGFSWVQNEILQFQKWFSWFFEFGDEIQTRAGSGVGGDGG